MPLSFERVRFMEVRRTELLMDPGNGASNCQSALLLHRCDRVWESSSEEEEGEEGEGGPCSERWISAS